MLLWPIYLHYNLDEGSVPDYIIDKFETATQAAGQDLWPGLNLHCFLPIGRYCALMLFTATFPCRVVLHLILANGKVSKAFIMIMTLLTRIISLV